MSEVRFNLGPFSHVIVEVPNFDADGQNRPIADVLEDSILVAKRLHEEFDIPQDPEPAQQEHEPYVGPDGDPGPQEDYAANAPGPRRAQPPQQLHRGVESREQMLKRSWGTCPDCGNDTKPSIAQYQEWENTDDGVEVPAKHFCTNDQCATKSLWRRQLAEMGPGF